MLSGPRWLALEVKYLDRARSFYESILNLPVREATGHEVRFAAGETDLVLRAPGPVPRGGLHTHYALATPPERYDSWHDRLAERFDLVERTFGDARSLYFYDVAGNCVEIGARGEGTDAISGLFEVVLEVESLARAVAFYEALGFDVVDRGADRQRVRLTAGDFDLELWEPHLGIADARGGVHVDLGIGAEDPHALADGVESQACDVAEIDGGVRIRDPDGHSLTLV
ncbi:MAG: VOC family protein [Haloarculaceae archaeon]